MKTTMRCHLTSVKMAIIKKKRQMLTRLWRNWNSSGYLSTLNVYIASQNYDQKTCIIYSDLPFRSGIKFFLSALD